MARVRHVLALEVVVLILALLLTLSTLAGSQWRAECEGTPRAVSWHPSGELIAVGASGSVLILRGSGEVYKRLEYPEDWVTRCLAWSPDGFYLAAGWESGEVRVFDDMGRELWSSDLEAPIWSLSWGPEDRLVVGVSGSVRVMTKAFKEVWDRALEGVVVSVSWSPDGALIAAGVVHGATQPRGEVYVLNASDGSTVWSMDFGEPVLAVSWSPDGRLLAVGGGYGRLLVVDREGGTLWSASLGLAVTCASWDPSGSYLAVGTAGHQVLVYARDGRRIWASDFLGGRVLDVAWSPSGDPVVVAAVEAGYARLLVVACSDRGILWRDLWFLVRSNPLLAPLYGSTLALPVLSVYLVVRPSLEFEVEPREVVRGVTKVMRIRVFNRGLLGTEQPIEVRVDGKTVFSGTVRVKGRGQTVVEFEVS